MRGRLVGTDPATETVRPSIPARPGLRVVLVERVLTCLVITGAVDVVESVGLLPAGGGPELGMPGAEPPACGLRTLPLLGWMPLNALA